MGTRREFVRIAAAAAVLAQTDLLSAAPKADPKPIAEIPADKPIRVSAIVFPRMAQIDLTGPFSVLSRLPNATVKLLWKTTDPNRRGSLRDGTGCFRTRSKRPCGAARRKGEGRGLSRHEERRRTAGRCQMAWAAAGQPGEGGSDRLPVAWRAGGQEPVGGRSGCAARSAGV